MKSFHFRRFISIRKQYVFFPYKDFLVFRMLRIIPDVRPSLYFQLPPPLKIQTTFDIETNFMLYENQLFWLFAENYSKRKHFASPHLVQLLSTKIVHFYDKSMKLCRITTNPKTNIFGYGAKPNSTLDTSTAQALKCPT